MEIRLIDAMQYDPSAVTITGADKLIGEGILGSGVTIAIIDTGISNHTAIPTSKIIGGRNFTEEGSASDYTDRNGHGTHVAGIIACDVNQHCKGIAPQCKLLILKVLTKEGRGTEEWLVKALNYAIDQKVDIINMSLGAPTGSDAIHMAIKRAVDNNICVVCAAGNSGDGNPDTEESDYPGCYEEVICVGAMGKSYNVSRFSDSNKYVDLVAYGERVMSTYLGNSFAMLSGTSMATPVVSGALALLIEYSTKEFGRHLLESELYGLLIKCTTNLNVSRKLQGNGRINLENYNK